MSLIIAKCDYTGSDSELVPVVTFVDRESMLDPSHNSVLSSDLTSAVVYVGRALNIRETCRLTFELSNVLLISYRKNRRGHSRLVQINLLEQ